MNKRLNWLIPLAFLVLGGVLLLLFFQNKPAPGSTVVVTVDGREYGRYSLGKPRDITIDLGNGEYNILHIDEEGVEMLSASCRDQLCVGQGKVTARNASSRVLGCDIICLPHRVVVSLIDLPENTQEVIPDA